MEGVQLVRVLPVVVLVLLLAVGDVPRLGLGVVVGQGLLLQKGGQPVIAHIGAVVGPDKGVQAGVIIAEPGGVQLGQKAVQVAPGVFGQGVPLGGRLLGQGGVGGQALHCVLHQVVVPGLAGLLIIHLLLDRDPGVEGVHAQGAQAVVDRAAVGGGVVILQLHGGVLGVPHRQRGEGALKDAAGPDHQHHGQQDYRPADASVERHGPAVRLLLLAAAFRPLRPALGIVLLL